MPVLRRCHVENPAEKARHVALISKAAAGRDNLQWNVLAGKQPLCMLKSLRHHISMWRVPEFGLEFPDKTKYTKLSHPGQFCQ